MKTYALLAATCLCLLFVITSPAKIRNGYAVDIESARASLQSLRILLAQDKTLSVFQRLTFHDKIKDLTEFITYYDFTEQLLGQFKMISPDFYYEIDSIKDRQGRSLDVFVKFVPEKQMPAGVAGVTIMDPDLQDKDVCTSEYGIGTVSIKVSAVKRSLFLLAHEFGHVKYQALNLQAYQQYYTKFYLASTYRAKSMGHNDKDPSGQLARNSTRKFQDDYLKFVRVSGNKIASHMALLQRIMDQVRKAG